MIEQITWASDIMLATNELRMRIKEGDAVLILNGFAQSATRARKLARRFLMSDLHGHLPKLNFMDNKLLTLCLITLVAPPTPKELNEAVETLVEKFSLKEFVLCDVCHRHAELLHSRDGRKVKNAQ